MLLRDGRLGRLTDHPVQRGEHAPAPRQGRIQLNGMRESADRFRRLSQEGMAMAALLEQPRVAGMRVLQPLQRRERLGHALQVAQGHGAHVEQVAVRRCVRQQAIGGRQRFTEAVLLDQLLYGGLHAGMMADRRPQRKRAGGSPRRPGSR